MANKKAQLTMIKIISILLVVASFSVVFLFVTLAAPKAAYAAEEKTCHSSVVFRTMASFNVGSGKVNLGPLLCKTSDQKISGTREELKSQISRMMAQCWWMFNEGRQDDTFDSASISKMFGWEDNKNKCFICYTALIDQDEIKEGPIGPGETFNYLLQNDHYQIKGSTYVDYIQSYGGPGQPVIMETVYPRGAYGVAYLSKSSDDSSFSVADTGAIIAAAGGVIAAAVCIGTVVCGLTGVAVMAAGAVGAGYEATHAYNAIKAKHFYSEKRDVSMVVFDNLKALEAGKCELITG